MNGKFCVFESIETKEQVKAFVYASERVDGDYAYHCLIADDECIHLDYVIHSITSEASAGNVPVESLHECVADAISDLGGTFDIIPYMRSFLASSYKGRVDTDREEYWLVEEESSEEEYGSY